MFENVTFENVIEHIGTIFIIGAGVAGVIEALKNEKMGENWREGLISIAIIGLGLYLFGGIR